MPKIRTHNRFKHGYRKMREKADMKTLYFDLLSGFAFLQQIPQHGTLVITAEGKCLEQNTYDPGLFNFPVLS